MDNQLCFKNPPRFDALNTSTSILWLNRTINIFNQQIFDKKKNKIKNYICKKKPVKYAGISACQCIPFQWDVLFETTWKVCPIVKLICNIIMSRQWQPNPAHHTNMLNCWIIFLVIFRFVLFLNILCKIVILTQTWLADF